MAAFEKADSFLGTDLPDNAENRVLLDGWLGEVARGCFPDEQIGRQETDK